MAEITYGSLCQQLVAVPHSAKLSVERTCRSTAEQRTRDGIIIIVYLQHKLLGSHR